MIRTDTSHRQRMRKRRNRLNEVRKNYRAKPLPKVREEYASQPMPGLLPAGMFFMFILMAVSSAVRKHAEPVVQPVVTTEAFGEELAVAGSGIVAEGQVPPPRHRTASSTNPYLVAMPDQNDIAADLGAPALAAEKREIVMSTSPWSVGETPSGSELLQEPVSTATPTPADKKVARKPVRLPKVTPEAASPTMVQSDEEVLNLEPMISRVSPKELESLEPLPATSLEPIAVKDGAVAESKIDMLKELSRSDAAAKMNASASGLPTSIEDVDTGEKKVLGAGELPMLDLTRRLLGE